jgi:signal recognition particle subunit SRP54
MASLDVQPSGRDGAAARAGRAGRVATLPIIAGQMPRRHRQARARAAKVGGYDVLILDTAGRQRSTKAMMAEVAADRAAVNPHETLLVADSLTGQDAVQHRQEAFNERVPLTGIILTRADGDARGGAALSMRAVTGAPIKFLGAGEKLDALEAFHPAAWPPASSTWAMSSRWSRRPRRPSTRPKPKRWPPR